MMEQNSTAETATPKRKLSQNWHVFIMMIIIIVIDCIFILPLRFSGAGDAVTPLGNVGGAIFSVFYILLAIVPYYLINFIVNLFRKNKRPVSLILLWILFIFTVLPYMYHIYAQKITIVKIRQDFISRCITNNGQGFANLPKKITPLTAVEIKSSCELAADEFLKIYHECDLIERDKSSTTTFKECIQAKLPDYMN